MLTFAGLGGDWVSVCLPDWQAQAVCVTEGKTAIPENRRADQNLGFGLQSGLGNPYIREGGLL